MPSRSDEEAQRIAHEEFALGDCPRRIRQQIYHLLLDWDPLCCSRCHQTGTVITIWALLDGGYEVVTAQCACVSFRQFNSNLDKRVTESLIPARYRNASLDSWRNPGSNGDEINLNARSMEVVSKFSSKVREMCGKGYGLFLCGPNGVGKTFLACAVANTAIREGINVKYYTMSSIVRNVIDGWYDEKKKSIIADIESAELLVIDDLDKTYKTRTGIEIAILDNLFRERLQNNRPVIITSNMTLDQIGTTHSASIFSMFMEHCAQCVIVGDDFRKSIAADVVADILS